MKISQDSGKLVVKYGGFAVIWIVLAVWFWVWRRERNFSRRKICMGLGVTFFIHTRILSRNCRRFARKIMNMRIVGTGEDCVGTIVRLRSRRSRCIIMVGWTG